MSYGQPWRRTTGEPLAGPASAYPTLSRPALICLSEAKDVCVPGLVAGTAVRLALLDCASAEVKTPSCTAAAVMAAELKKRRRLWSISSGILIFFIVEPPGSVAQYRVVKSGFWRALRLQLSAVGEVKPHVPVDEHREACSQGS